MHKYIQYVKYLCNMTKQEQIKHDEGIDHACHWDRFAYDLFFEDRCYINL